MLHPLQFASIPSFAVQLDSVVHSRCDVGRVRSINMPYGARFANGSAFYCGRHFTARHLARVNSPLATGYISPTAFLSTSVMAVGATAWSPLSAADAVVKGATAFECDAEVVEPAQPGAAAVRADNETMCGTHLICTFLKISCMPVVINIKVGHQSSSRGLNKE
jgi:hypothetical protein